MSGPHEVPPVSVVPRTASTSPVPDLTDYASHLERHFARLARQTQPPAFPVSDLLQPLLPSSAFPSKGDKKPRMASPLMRAVKITNLPPEIKPSHFWHILSRGTKPHQIIDAGISMSVVLQDGTVSSH
jgi:hypothetical protein